MLVLLNMTSATGSTVHADQCTFCYHILMNSSNNDKRFIQKFKRKSKHILCSVTFFPKVVPLWDNVGKHGRARKATDDNITWRIRFECWINNTTDTHSECVTLIAFPRKQSLRERASSPLYVRCMSCWVLFWCKKRCYGQMGHICKFNIHTATHGRTHMCARSLSS